MDNIQFKGSVLVIGDIMLDQFISGEATKISPEAPIPVFTKGKTSTMLGGAGNVAANLSELGMHVGILALVGNDDAAGIISECLHEMMINDYTITVKNNTTTKVRYIHNQHQMFRCDDDLITTENTKIIEKFEQLVNRYDSIVMSDYGKGVITNKTAQHIIKISNQQGMKVFIDPKGKSYKKYTGAYMITPNRKELSDAVGHDVIGSEIQYANDIAEKFNIENVLVTLSQDGMVLVNDTTREQFETAAIEVFDVSGAGDTVISTIAAACVSGYPITEAVMIANIAAGYVVGKFGTATITVDTLNRLMTNKPEISTTLDEAIETVEHWKNEGLKVGFTNGCFDLIHPGHIKVLSESKRVCDRLVVGLNSDQSVKALKGEDRPYQTELDRATVLLEMQSVDMVILFDDETPIKLIESITPSILIKGGDYIVKDIVGYGHVIDNGGKVITIDLVTGKSTTSIIQKLNS